jgi:hypothetical protein
MIWPLATTALVLVVYAFVLFVVFEARRGTTVRPFAPGGDAG